MPMIRKLLLIISLAVLLSACAAKYATGPQFSEAPLPPAHKGTLYIYRADAPLVWTPTVKINNKPFLELSKLGYSYVYLTPGIYRLTFDYGGLDSSFVTEILIDEGKVVFKGLYDSGGHKVLEDLPRDQALDKIKEYRYIEPLNTEFQ